MKFWDRLWARSELIKCWTPLTSGCSRRYLPAHCNRWALSITEPCMRTSTADVLRLHAHNSCSSVTTLCQFQRSVREVCTLTSAVTLVYNLKLLWGYRLCLQCFDAVGWAVWRASDLSKLSAEVLASWRGYLSGARCKWFAYGPADSTATPSSLAPIKSRMVYLPGAGLYPGCPGKKAGKWM